MRRLAALAVTLTLAWLVVARVDPNAQGGGALALGVALLAASIVGWLCQFLRLPRVTAYLALGLVCGPSVANIITVAMARDLQAISGFAIVVIAVIAGLRVDAADWRSRWREASAFALVTMGVAWCGLFAVFGLTWPWLPIAPELDAWTRLAASAVSATLVVAVSPIVTMAVVTESRARGRLADFATDVSVVIEIAVLVLFAVCVTVARSAFDTPVSAEASQVVRVGWAVLGSVAFGVLLGAPFALYLKYVGREVTVVLLALCAMLSVFSAVLFLEPLLVGLAAGIVVKRALPAAAAVLHDALEHGAMPALVLFFAAAGASMHLETIATVGVFALALAAVRAGLLRLGTRAAARVVAVQAPEMDVLWRALVPTGIALSLVATVMADHPIWGRQLASLLVAMAAISQLVGPILFRAALVQTREIGGPASELVVVSNREPWIHERMPDQTIVARPTPGGVSVALDALMRERGGVWIAHGAGSADRDVVDERHSVEVPPDAPAYRLRRLWLTPGQEERYYTGFSNSALWPLCHQAHVKPVFRAEDWEGYQQVNRLFADAAAIEAPPECSVFLNDYHLALVAATLRQRRPLLRTALFWHIPWPDTDRLRICPWRQEILTGLLSNDLLAFQLPRDQKNFLNAVADELGAETSGETVYFHDRQVRVLSIPIGADFDRISTILADDALAGEIDRLTGELDLEGKVVGVGVDRLDYTKGIPERIAAIDRLLADRPDLVDTFAFVQVGVPSRADVPGYAEISTEIEGLVAALNRKYAGRGGRGPIRYLATSLAMPHLVALYCLADFCIVSSLHDGMNLVAKEFVAARADLDGVLILSELAGAAQELTESLIINPYDERGFTAAIARAVDMPIWERRRRMQALRRRVAGRDVLAWASDILDRLERRKGHGFLSG